MRNVDDDIPMLGLAGKRVPVYTSPFRTGKLDSNPGVQDCFVVAQLGHVRLSPFVHQSVQGVLDLSCIWHLGHNTVLWSTSSAALVKHAEAGDFAPGEIARVRIDLAVFQVWAQLHYAKRPADSWEIVASFYIPYL